MMSLADRHELFDCCRFPVVDYSDVNHLGTGICEQSVFCTRCGRWKVYRFIPALNAVPPLLTDSSEARPAERYQQPPARFAFPPKVRRQGLKRRYIEYQRRGEVVFEGEEA